MTSSPRKKKLINASLQLRLIATFVSISCLAALAQVILLANSMLDLGHTLGPTGKEFNRLLPGILAEDIASTFGLLVPFMLLVGLHITHRVAGPLYAIDKYLGEVADRGRVDRKCQVRDTDELQALVRAINAAFARLEAKQRTDAATGSSSVDPPSLIPASAAHRESSDLERHTA